MLKLLDQTRPMPEEPPERPAKKLDLKDMIMILRRQWPVILACTLVGMLLALGYAATAAPRYTASVKLLIDTRKNNVMSKQEVNFGGPVDAGAVESQVEILKSEGVARSVIRDQQLLKDPEFVGSGSPSLIGSLLSILSSSDAEPTVRSDEDIERDAIQNFVRRVTAKRVGLTYVIQVDFQSGNAEKSARIANAIADAYMVGELDAKFQATRRASRWLQERIAELKTQATQSDLAVQAFKADNNIVDTSRGLMSEQSLADVNSQLIQARAVTAEAKARLDRVREISNGNLPDATVADALRNDVINRARAQYLDAARKEADWSAKYGPQHSATVNLRNQMEELKRSIIDEVRRIAQTYESDYNIARAREVSLETSLSKLVDQAGTTSQAQVKLRELESSSQTYRNLYDTFLQKFEEATQQQTFPITEARVITPATEPSGKSGPKTMLIVPAGTIAGFMMGLVAAIGLELLNSFFRTPAEIKQQTGLECIGILPSVPDSNASPPAMVDVASKVALGKGSRFRHVVDTPFSRYTEVLRNVKVSIDIARLGREVRVIGLISSLPKEGKTTVAANLAELVAQTGHRVLLVDGDLRNPTLTRNLTPHAEVGVVEVLRRSISLADGVCRDTDTGLDFLPAVIPQRIPNTAELLSSMAMAQLLSDARGTYEYVFVDFAPIMSVADAKAAAHLIDAFVYVVEWGKTSQHAVVEALSNAPAIHERTLGVVLNNADVAALKRLEFYKGRYYSNYYHEEAA